MKKLFEYLIIMFVTLIIFFVYVYFLDKKEQPRFKTQTTHFRAQNDTIYTNLTVNTSTRKEGGRSHPITFSGISIHTAYKTKCCAVSKDILKRNNLKMLQTIKIESDYPVINGNYLIIDKNNINSNTIELIIKDTNIFKLKFFLYNQKTILKK